MRRWIGAAAIVGAMIFLGAAALAFASEEEEEVTRQDLHWGEKPSFGTWSLDGSLMLFSSKRYAEVYNNKPVGFINMNASWKMIQQFELIGSIGFATATGHGVAPQDGLPTADKYLLDFAPGSLGLAYRFNFVFDQPVVPYLGAFGQLAYWYETRLDSGWKTRSWNYGAAGFGGVMFLLNNIEKRASGLLRSQWGINNTYFFYEFRDSWLNNFNQKNIIDLSSQGHHFGFMIEF
jgi:hypothetical protein